MIMETNMFEYTITVDNDEPSSRNTFTVKSSKPIDTRLLKVCGLIMDDGITKEPFLDMYHTAQAYVDVEGIPYDAPYITNYLRNRHDS